MSSRQWENAPRIGVTTAYKAEAQAIESNYIRAVETAGGLPVIMPMIRSPHAIRTLVAGLDGLVIVGGPAITRGLVGDLPGDLNQTDPVRTASDEKILGAALEMAKPILGICYGMQLLNAWAGGTIYADVQQQWRGARNHSEIRGAGPHPIQIKAGSRLHQILGLEKLEVNSNHIQALADVGEGFRVTATAPDGVIEAIEHQQAPIMGVQFHPERMLDRMLHLFEHFVEFCQSE